MRQVITFAEDCGDTEGPVVMQDGSVAFVAVDRGQVLRVADGQGPRVLAETLGGANAATEGLGGVLYIAQNGGRPPYATPSPSVTGGVQVVHPTGRVDWVTQDPVSPNDLCLGPDGMLYVTDPTRNPGGGVDRDDGRLWRVDPVSGDAEILTSTRWYPNGIGFGLEHDALYVANTFQSRIERFEIRGDGRLGPHETVVSLVRNMPDGFTFTEDGCLVVAAISFDPDVPGEIQTYDPAGKLLDAFVPNGNPYLTNVALTPDRRLYITDASLRGVLLVEDWPHAGLPLHPFRGEE